jgi:predicted RNA-binding Zn-ribbon protein involved in translation (DUF1610 family)
MLALFDPARVQHGDKLVRGYKIVCGNCGRSERIACNSVAGAPNDEEETRLAARKFTTAGWLIGRRVKDHRCPSCSELMVKRNREERVGKVNGVEPPAVLHLAPALLPLVGQQHQPKPELPAPAAPLEETAPRSMTRDDRRLIWAKLEDVYADETSGYKPGWSDGRVARDLGIPLAWVKIVRDENFGALADNPQVRAIVEEARGLLEDIKAQVASAQQMAVDFESVTQTIADTERRVIELEKQLASLIDQPS